MVKMALSDFADTEMCLHQLHKTSTVVKMALLGPSWHLHKLVRVTQPTHSDESCFLDLS